MVYEKYTISLKLILYQWIGGMVELAINEALTIRIYGNDAYLQL